MPNRKPPEGGSRALRFSATSSHCGVAARPVGDAGTTGEGSGMVTVMQFDGGDSTPASTAVT